MEFPKIRNIEALPAMVDGNQVIVLRDPSGLSESILTVTSHLIYLLQYFDGRHTQKQILDEFNQKFENVLSTNQFEDVLKTLDEHLFLENDTFNIYMDKLKNDFSKQGTRMAKHAGLAYAAEEKELMDQLSSYFADCPETVKLLCRKSEPVKALIVPHIDVKAGGICFASAYETLRDVKNIDSVIILGTGHSPIENFFALTRKDFITPLGTAKTDNDFIDSLNDTLGYDSTIGELSHRTEHTIEFQVIFLQYILNSVDFKIVPILCSFDPVMADDSLMPDTASEINGFIDALKKTISSRPGRHLLISSADLAHVGPRYGDKEPPSDEFLNWVRQQDERLFDLLSKNDIRGMHELLIKNNQACRICGFPPIYTMMHCLEADHAEILNYDEAKVDERNSTVTFVSMAYY